MDSFGLKCLRTFKFPEIRSTSDGFKFFFSIITSCLKSPCNILGQSHPKVGLIVFWAKVTPTLGSQTPQIFNFITLVNIFQGMILLVFFCRPHLLFLNRTKVFFIWSSSLTFPEMYPIFFYLVALNNNNKNRFNVFLFSNVFFAYWPIRVSDGILHFMVMTLIMHYIIMKCYCKSYLSIVAVNFLQRWLFFADFSVNSKSISMKFCKHSFQL